jgi:regulatory protein
MKAKSSQKKSKQKKNLKSNGSPAKALQYALKLLNYRSRSENEIIQRLNKRGFSRNHIDKTLQYLKDSGLVKDDVLASDLLKFTIEKKYLARKGIKSFLQQRGITKDVITQTLSGLTEDTERETARKLIEKKLKTMKIYSRDTAKRRLWGMLQRRGFSFGIIRSAINSAEDKNRSGIKIS